ncbi:MAG: hypothetical protein VX653_03260 [Candidatus Thermoplasmatota archaeon]|nr:hypothetical protein [Candidatus Thermoplasmatota archaeon]
MEWPPGPYEYAMFALLAMTIPIQRFLTRDEVHMRVPLRGLLDEIRDKGYWWHIALYALMFIYKALIDHHNEPMKARVGGYTHWIHDIEGDWTLWVQETFYNDLLTDLLSAHYLFMYLFIIWFSPMYYILSRDEVMADKAALNYFVIYLLAVPLYLFFNIEVTSSFIPGMESPLYYDDFTLAFFTSHDPMDNAIPSLHIGLPISLLILNRLHCRSLGIDIKDWRHREFDLFVLVNVVIYAFSIQYIGIHWVVDIIPGIILAIVCAAFCHAIQPIVRETSLTDWRDLLPDRQQTIFAAISVVLFSGVLIFGAIDGPGTDENIPNYRLGPGDFIIDTVEVHSLSHPVIVEISNVGEPNPELVGTMGLSCGIWKRSHIVDYFDRGRFAAGYDFYDLLDEPHHKVNWLKPGESWQEEIETDSIFDTNLIVCDSPDGVSELRITMHYFDDELMWSALLSSWPSFIIFGIAVEGLTYRSKQIESDDIADVDS